LLKNKKPRQNSAFRNSESKNRGRIRHSGTGNPRTAAEFGIPEQEIQEPRQNSAFLNSESKNRGRGIKNCSSIAENQELQQYDRAIKELTRTIVPCIWCSNGPWHSEYER